MEFNLSFILTSMLLGVGLAMDAFSVSLANGLNETKMRKRKMCCIAGVFAGFQFAMPMIGWFCVSTIAHIFKTFEKFIPWIALILLLYIGGSMLFDAIRNNDPEDETPAVGVMALLVQGVATSIDALSVGFTIASYNMYEAACASLIIGIVTFIICYAGLYIGKKAGTKLADKAGILGGAILIFIGIKIFIESLI